MALQINSIDQLADLVKKTGAQVNSAEELKDLLAAINAQQQPLARLQAAAAPPCIAAGAAGIATIVLLAVNANPTHQALSAGALVAVLAIIWGAVAFLGLVSGVCMRVLSRQDRAPAPAPNALAPRPAPSPRPLTHPTGILTADQ